MNPICALHLVAETVKVRNSYPNVDKLIGAVKAIFRKSPSLIVKYKYMYPNLSLAPGLILVRWGTWLEAADFYTNHYNEVKTV